MRSKNAKKEFEKVLTARGHTGLPIWPEDGVKAMFEFYRSIRAKDTDLDSDGDMLLFEWGTYTIYDIEGRPLFVLDITRQLIRGRGRDEDIWQLRLIYRYAPSEALAILGEGNQWCTTPSELPDFEKSVSENPAFIAVKRCTPGSVELYYECVG